MGTNCAPLVADLFLFCYERDFMNDLSSDNQANVIKAFNSTSRYLDDLLNIDNPYFEGMVNQIYPSELQLNKANTSDTEAPFWIYICLFLTVLFHPKSRPSSAVRPVRPWPDHFFGRKWFWPDSFFGRL